MGPHSELIWILFHSTPYTSRRAPTMELYKMQCVRFMTPNGVEYPSGIWQGPNYGTNWPFTFRGNDDSKNKKKLTDLIPRHKLLRNDKFLRELESDSVDTELLDEELRSLEEHEPKTCRGKLVRVLESNPLQIFFCFLIFLDAVVVLAEILLDLHSIRAEQIKTQEELDYLINATHRGHMSQFHGYTGHNVQKMVKILNEYYNINHSDSDAHHRRRRDLQEDTRMLLQQLHLPVLTEICSHVTKNLRNTASWTAPNGDILDGTTDAKPPPFYLCARQETASAYHIPSSGKACRRCNKYLHHISSDIRSLKSELSNINGELNQYSSQAGPIVYMQQVPPNKNSKSGLEVDSETAREPELPYQDTADATPKTEQKRSLTDSSENHTDSPGNHSDGHHGDDHDEHHHDHAHLLHEIVHILHICSTVILGIFVVAIVLKVYGMGAEFFKRKLEIFDGVIILASFALDIATLNPIGGQGEGAVAFLMIFLLWRILRVINGIMVTAKQRQEFRIKLQKRARRRTERKLESMQVEGQSRLKEIAALRELCRKAGVQEQEINACHAKRVALTKPSTQVGLSSVMNLSLGLSMSVAGSSKNGDVTKSDPNLETRDSPLDIPASDMRRNSAFPRLDAPVDIENSSGATSPSSPGNEINVEFTVNSNVENNNEEKTCESPETTERGDTENAEVVPSSEGEERQTEKPRPVSMLSTETVDSQLSSDELTDANDSPKKTTAIQGFDMQPKEVSNMQNGKGGRSNGTGNSIAQGGKRKSTGSASTDISAGSNGAGSPSLDLDSPITSNANFETAQSPKVTISPDKTPTTAAPPGKLLQNGKVNLYVNDVEEDSKL